MDQIARQVEVEILKAGQEYAELKALPGYKRLLDFLEESADAALSRLRQSASSDPNVERGLAMAWRIREKVLQEIQQEVKDAIDARLVLIQQIAESQQPAGPSSFDTLGMEEMIQ